MSVKRDASFLVKLLTPAVGPLVADEKVGAAVRKLRLDAGALSEAQALDVLEDLARERGIVGAASRFAKVRLVLAWAQG